LPLCASGEARWKIECQKKIPKGSASVSTGRQPKREETKFEWYGRWYAIHVAKARRNTLGLAAQSVGIGETKGEPLITN
jgi:hypothetical protein